ncbi:hypothetical protein [Phyllobacterium chamaecytisi]|uniref:hypothetical protein n=1 Tax=Phyllobacterium chamaecytisi TaxID=2876082 RepID=UPI001CCE139E|nr:hypothetical protein [Phyllobacterium sp. KW56]MBZ9603945.1 hypothetical protein [Phyllobacterium sp. KW56]
MTSRLKISQRQIEAIAKGAAKAGCRVEITIGEVVVTLIPESSCKLAVPAQEDDFRL